MSPAIQGRALFHHRDSGGRAEMTPVQYVEWARQTAEELNLSFDRPQIRLAPARPGADVLNPRHYVYFESGWGSQHRAKFEALGPRAFSAEYMYWIAKYEAALARVKHHRDYWFFPAESMSKMYCVSPGFVGTGLRSLVELGVMRVAHGQYAQQAVDDEFGAANRYYFQGLGELVRRQWQFEGLEAEYKREFPLAQTLAAKLTNGQTVKNVEGLCELIAAYGKGPVRRAIEQVAALPTRSLRRRLAYVRAIVSGTAEPR